NNSYIPTFVLSRFVRKHVKTALGGDGGDELFLGYPTFQAEKAAGFLHPLMPKSIVGALKNLSSLLPVSFENISLDFKIKRFLDGLAADPVLRHFVWIGGLNPADQTRLLASQEEAGDIFGEFIRLRMSSPSAALDMREISRLYMKIYLQDDILAKVDRASMANSLEARAPLLDYEFVDFVQSLPLNLRMKGLRMKYLLKKALAGKIPGEILNRGKKGFGLPLGLWLRSDLKWLLDEYLNESRARKGGFFKPDAVKRMVSEHLSGKKDNRKPLYSLIVFEIWREKNGL
ncbi:MAG: asparagine synthetase B, partial [Deltaproteobacteria bacterium]|nr:asparagine synthetase B [Deltaproteobacteria bacterium]